MIAISDVSFSDEIWEGDCYIGVLYNNFFDALVLLDHCNKEGYELIHYSNEWVDSIYDCERDSYYNALFSVDGIEGRYVIFKLTAIGGDEFDEDFDNSQHFTRIIDRIENVIYESLSGISG